MRIALFDIAAPLADRLRPYLADDDVIVDVPERRPMRRSRSTCSSPRASRRRRRRAPPAACCRRRAPAPTRSTSTRSPRGRAICNAYEHEGPIAEYVFAAILDHAVGYGAMTRRIAEQGWGGAYFSRPPHGEVAGRTIGLVGLGHIGAAIAAPRQGLRHDGDGGDRLSAGRARRTSTGSPHPSGSTSCSPGRTTSCSPARSPRRRAACSRCAN